MGFRVSGLQGLEFRFQGLWCRVVALVLVALLRKVSGGGSAMKWGSPHYKPG